MKVYISVDMEGATGICLQEQCRKENPMFSEARRLLLSDVNAAVEGAVKAGATEILVGDLHGSSFNLPFEGLHPKARLLCGAPISHPRMPFIDKSYGVILLIAYHAKAGTLGAVLEHTMSSADWFKVTVNGREIGEIGIEAGIAGAMGIPIALVTGDDKACAEAKEWIPGVETAVVKTGLFRFQARMLPMEETRVLIRDAAEKAVKKAKKIKPIVIPGPVEVRITYKHVSSADNARMTPGAVRLDGYTVTYRYERFEDWYGGLWKTTSRG